MKRELLVFALLILLGSCTEDNASTPKGPYFSRVKNIISSNCLSCHSSNGSWSGRPVKFDSDADIANAASSIKAAVAGPFTFINKKMPEGGSLIQTDVDIILAWYNAGGKTTD